MARTKLIYQSKQTKQVGDISLAYQVNKELYCLCQIYAVCVEIGTEFKVGRDWISCRDRSSCKECEKEAIAHGVYLRTLISTKGDRSRG